jgi:hypothetical protein
MIRIIIQLAIVSLIVAELALGGNVRIGHATNNVCEQHMRDFQLNFLLTSEDISLRPTSRIKVRSPDTESDFVMEHPASSIQYLELCRL